MYQIPGFSIQSTLHSSPDSIVYRGLREEDRLPVILKMVANPRPSRGEIARLKREFGLLQKRSHPHLIEALALTPLEDRWVLVLQDIGGRSLGEWLDFKPFALDEFFAIALAATEALDALHQSRIIHKDINPSNIVWNSSTRQTQVIDLSISSLQVSEYQFAEAQSSFEGTLAYMSPEQTGRMNRAVDARSDVYSLGVTLFELLTQRSPYRVPEDPVGYLHAHLAQRPACAREFRPDLPPMLSDILARMMAKNAEDRYQTMAGLRRDLERCAEAWSRLGEIPTFALADADYRAEFKLPQALYGREPLLARMQAAHQRARRGERGILLLEGPAGAGKTSLALELQRSVLSQAGTFVRGAFHPQRDEGPYAPLLRGLRSELQGLLRADAETLEGRKRELRDALQNNLALFAPFLPELELLFGPMAPPPKIPASEHQNRFFLGLRELLRLFSSDGPLVLLLDDLHWAAHGSFALIQQLWSAPELTHILWIGTYRPEELDPSSPFGQLKQSTPDIETLSLEPLSTQDISSFLQETLQRPGEGLSGLAHTLREKTHGNPFYLREFVHHLHRRGLFTFDPEQKAWGWQLEAIEKEGVTDNVADLLQAKFGQLTPATREALQKAAVLGRDFDLLELVELAGWPVSTLYEALQEALALGFAFPLTPHEPWVELPEKEALVPGQRYRFSHDRVLHFIQAGLPSALEQELHRAIVALRWQAEKQSASEIFDFVHHLNQGWPVGAFEEGEDVQGLVTREGLARWNQRAADKARAAAAFDHSLAYCQKARDALFDGRGELFDEGLEKELWEREHDLLFSITHDLAEAHASTGAFEQGKAAAQWALDHAKSHAERQEILITMMSLFYLANRGQEVLELALEQLEALGQPLPAEISQELSMEAFAESKAAWASQEPAALADAADVSDPQRAYQFFLMGCISTLAMQSDPMLSNYAMCKLITYQLREGQIPESGFVYMMYGMSLATMYGEPEAGYQFGRVALSLLERGGDARDIATGQIMFNTNLRHWHEPLQASIEQLPEIYEKTAELGGFNGLSNIAANYYSLCLWGGKDLPTLAQEMERYNGLQARIGAMFMLSTCQMLQQLVHNLQDDQHPEPWVLSGPILEAQAMRAQCEQFQDGLSLNYLTLFEALLPFLFGREELAQERLQKMEPIVGFFYGSINFAYYKGLDSLVKLSGWSEASEGERAERLAAVEANQAALGLWTHQVPENFGYLHSWVEARKAEVLQHSLDARKHYEEAAQRAQEGRAALGEAALCRHAALFFLAEGNRRAARHFLVDAYDTWLRWGAHSPALALVREFPEYLQAHHEQHHSSSTSAGATTTTGPRDHDELDMMSVLKSAQALSEELELEKLQRSLMKILIENTGAQRGCLLLPEAEGWTIAIHGEHPIEEIPQSVLNYVANTHQEVVLEDAVGEEPYSRDPVIQKQQSRSILCAPLLHKEQLRGICYFDNPLTRGAFTRDRLATMQLLANQAAISLDHAQLYQQLEQYNQTLEQKVRSRTEALTLAIHDAELARAEAETANRNKTAFLSQMNHELRTPLNAIIGFSRLVHRWGSGSLPKKQLASLSMVIESGGKLLSLIDQILDLAKIELGQVELELCSFPVEELVESCAMMVRPTLRPGVQLESRFDADLPELLTDREKLRHILQNLLSNAAKFTHQGSVCISVSQAPDALEFAVEDTGIGIPKGSLEAIFEEFRQAESTTRRDYGGTGLGLPICRRFARMLRGEIQVQSEQGQGSIFRLVLPYKHPDSAAHNT